MLLARFGAAASAGNDLTVALERFVDGKRAA